MNKNNKIFFAEILESHLSYWISQSWDSNYFPKYGELVFTKINTTKIYGIVADIETKPIDAMRAPIAYRKSESELLLEQPQLFEFIKTNFTSITVGYEENNKIFYNYPSSPPKLHSFVGETTNIEYEYFFKNPIFLNRIFNESNCKINLDELIIAILKQLSKKKILQAEFVESFLDYILFYFKNDYKKLKLFTSQIQNLI